MASSGHGLDPVASSQLTLAFNKVLKLGSKTRAEFFAEAKSDDMYGPELTDEVMDQLFLVYKTCALTSPDYKSKSKSTKKNYKKNKQTNDDGVEQSGNFTEHEMTFVCLVCGSESHDGDGMTMTERGYMCLACIASSSSSGPVAVAEQSFGQLEVFALHHHLCCAASLLSLCLRLLQQIACGRSTAGIGSTGAATHWRRR